MTGRKPDPVYMAGFYFGKYTGIHWLLGHLRRWKAQRKVEDKPLPEDNAAP